MFKVVLWDYTGESENWAKTFLKSGVEIIRTLRPNDADQAEVIMRGDWNFVLIFENGEREIFNEIFKTMQAMNFSTNNIVFAKDFYSWLNNPAAVYALLKPEACDNLYRHWTLFNQMRWNNYTTCTADNISYISPSKDPLRMPYMFFNRVNWASNDMKRFHELSEQYYRVDDSAGYFLDLGANIGTTGIYFIKNIAQNLKLLAFEPDPENFKMHRVNIILNDLDATTTLVNCGLGNDTRELMLYRNGSNPGAIGFIKHKQSTPITTIKIIALDTYLAENKIAAQDVKYIWIDTEGFEPQVLLGAKNLISENPAPIFMECNLRAWDESGLFEEMMTLIEAHYSHFVLFMGGNATKNRNETMLPVEVLRTLKRPNNSLGQLGDIFLIKRGTVA